MKIIMLLFLATLAAPAFAAIGVDLVDHNGFEACWSKAVTKATFLQRIRDSVDGQTFCVGESSDSGAGVSYDACNTPACPGNVVGCPVVAHADAFSGDFGTGSFSASGSADDISVPISYATPGGGGACTITVSNIELAYAPDYFAVPDGNFGSYMAYLSQSAISVTNENTSVDPAGNLVCVSLLSILKDSFIAQAESVASDAWAPVLAADTEGESVCPLSP